MGIEIQSTKEQKFLSDLKDIVATAKCRGYEAVNQVIVTCNWLIGRRIVEQEQQGKERAEYGKFVIKKASEFLTDEFGKGYSVTNLKNFRSFYLAFSSYFSSSEMEKSNRSDASDQMGIAQIGQTRLPNLSWSHYECLLRVKDIDARNWYRFLLVDLKTSQVTHQDIGQMDMYIRMYDELECTNGDNPTIGLLLCAETSKDLARYSILRDSNQLFAAKYMTYLPKKEELLLEIERQKYLFELQQGKKMRDK